MANLILLTCVNFLIAPARGVAAYQLASWIRHHGYTVKVIDFCHLIQTNDLVNIVEKHIGPETLAIGVSSTFWNGEIQTSRDFPEPDWVLNAHRLISSRHKLPWLLGGYAAASPKLSQEWWVKFHSNAEDALLKWMDENSSKLRRRELFDIKTLTKSFVEDDFIQPFEVMPIELGRGCMFKCRFCRYDLLGKTPGTYLRDYGLLKDEFLRNYDEWGTTKYSYLDDTVNESEEKVRALADIAQSLPFKLEWVGYNRLDLICRRPGMIQMLKDSGLRSAYFGIESFHPRASLVVGKGWSGKEAKDFLLKLKKEWNEDITWYLSFIIGLPGEDRASIEDSNQWCIDNGMYEWTFHPLNINLSPGKLLKSEFDREYEKYGYSFPFNDGLNWKNDLWTWKEARQYSLELIGRTTTEHKPTAWFLAQLVGLGYNYEDLMHRVKKTIDWKIFENKTVEIIQSYVTHQMKD